MNIADGYFWIALKAGVENGAACGIVEIGQKSGDFSARKESSPALQNNGDPAINVDRKNHED
jgi:hypothetical protein